MNYFRHLVKGSIYYIIGAILASIIAYFTKIYLAKTLTLEDFGLFFAVFSFVLFFNIFRTLGMPQSLVKFIPEFNVKKQENKIYQLIGYVLKVQVIASLIIIVFLWISADFLAMNFFNDERASWILKLLSLYVFFELFSSNFNNIFLGFKDNKWYSFGMFFKNFFVLMIVFISINLNLGLLAPILGYVGSNILFLLISYFGFKKHIDIRKINFKKSNIEKKILKYSLPLIFVSAGSMIINYFDTLMLIYYSTLEAVGIYNIIYPSVLILLLFGTAIGTIFMPVVSEFWIKKKYREINYMIETIYKYIFLILIPIIVLLISTSQVLIRLFLGTEFLPGLMAFQILLVGIIFFILATINLNFFMGIGEVNKNMRVYLEGAGLNIILNFLFIPNFGLIGAAIATALTYIYMMVRTIIFIKTLNNIHIPLKNWLLTIIASLSIYFIYNLQLNFNNIYFEKLLLIGIGGIIYLCLIILFGLFKPKEIKRFADYYKLK